VGLSEQESIALDALSELEAKQISINEAVRQVSQGYIETLGLEVERRQFDKGAFSMVVPSSFVAVEIMSKLPLMPEVVLRFSNVSAAKPLDESVTLIIDYGKFEYKNESVGTSLEQIAATVVQLSPSSRLYKSGVFEIGTNRIEYLEYFDSKATGDMFNDFFQMSVQGQGFSCQFMCSSDDARLWRNIFWALMKSARF